MDADASRWAAMRARYRPASIRVLMVGESPPVGGTFFYACDSNLFRYTRQAFEQACRRRWGDGEAFLRFFADNGFFLDDLCECPVNHLPEADRRRASREGVASLAERIAAMNPQAVWVTPKSILPHVKAAIRSSKSSLRPDSLPFPTMSWQAAYVDQLSRLVKQAMATADQ